MKKPKKKYFANLNEKYIFWKTIKPSLTYKALARGRTNLSEKGESVKTELETAKVINNKLFSNIVTNLEISKYSEYESFIDNIEDQIPSSIAILKKFKGRVAFWY